MIITNTEDMRVTPDRYPIIQSMLDTDHYKLTMGSVVFHKFPKAVVEYVFINRNKTIFPKGFVEALEHQINLMACISLQDDEFKWLKKIPYLRSTYIEWFNGYRFDPNEVNVSMDDNGQLQLSIKGLWYRTIFWEVVLMAIISELYFVMTGQSMDSDWEQRIENKAVNLSTNGCHWIDFGTRRRYSYKVQDAVVRRMRYCDGFLGTSNPHLAHKYSVTPHGTYAHESVMGMSALYGVRMANKMWMEHWSEHFDGDVGVALTDTFTTENFLQSFGKYNARLFDGVRQDSHDPYGWGNKMLKHYASLNIKTTNKRLVFSDSLDDTKYIAIDKYFRQDSQPIGGIGTFFTNDVGVKPLNMVIKLSRADFGTGWVDVVKLSDSPGKHTGNLIQIALVKQELNIQ